VRTNDETVYLSRADVRELIPGPIYLGHKGESRQYLLRRDPVNKLLCNLSDLDWNERVEVDLSSLPIVRVKKGTRTGRAKRKG
jgi:hypothetical protein